MIQAQNSLSKIVPVETKQQIQKIVQFQLNMAKETQNLQLNRTLVEQAGQYLVQNSKYGYYLVSKQLHQPEGRWDVAGCIMCTFENEESSWIQSVYVLPEYRRRGIFTSLFNQIIRMAREAGRKRVSLYAEEENHRALGVYQKLGMRILDQQIFGFDFAYGSSFELPKQLTGTEQITFQLAQGDLSDTSGLEDLLGKRKSSNRQIVGRFNNQVVLYCEFFEEFSDWRFGRMIYLSVILIKAGLQGLALNGVMSWLKGWEGVRVQAIRVIQEKSHPVELSKWLSTIERLHYHILEISL